MRQCNLPIAIPITPSIKVSHLERTVDSIRKMQIEFPCQVNACVIEKLQRNLKVNKKQAVNYIKECFESLLSDDGFLKWLAKGLKYKPCPSKQLLEEKKCNRRNGHIISTEYQNIYDF